MAKKKKKSPSAPTILALQRPDPTSKEERTDPTESSLPSAEDGKDVLAETTPPTHSDAVASPEPQPSAPELQKDLATNPIETTTKVAGETFSVGDRILVKAPWGKDAIAQIRSIYQDNDGSTWAQYKPLVDEFPQGWSWFGGICRAELLVTAEQ